MNTYSWYAYQNADCDSFNVYRSICGITIPFPNALVIGDVLKFSATSPDLQYFTLTAVDIDSVLALINTKGRGVQATKNADGSKLFIRCRADASARFKLTGSAEFLSHTSQTSRTIIPQLEWELIGSLPFVSGQFNYTYSDPDGIALDFYRVTSVKAGVESLPSVTTRPILDPLQVCVLEGRLIDNQAEPLPNATVTATLQVTGQTSDEFLSSTAVSTQTDSYGRFSLPMIRLQQYLLQIPAVSYNEAITTPDMPTARLIDMIPTLEGRFSPYGDPQ